MNEPVLALAGLAKSYLKGRPGEVRVLDGLDLGDDAIRLFAVDRSAQGNTVVRRVEVDAPLLAKAREGWPLSRLWVSGHLGGVPDV